MKNTIIKVFIFNVISKAISAITIVYLIRMLTTKDYALFTNFQSFYNFFGMFIFSAFNYSLSRYSTYYISKYNNIPFFVYKKIINLEVILYLILIITIIPFTNVISEYLFNNVTYSKSILFGILSGFGLMFSNIFFFIFQSQERFNSYNVLNLIRPTLILLFIFIFQVFMRINFNVIALSYLFSQVLFSLVIYYLIKKNEPNNIEQKEHFTYVGFLEENKYLIIYFLILEIINQIDIFMLTRFTNSYELANYGVALRYYGLLMLLLGSVNTVLLPKLAKQDMLSWGNQSNFINLWLKKVGFLVILVPIVTFLLKDVYIFINGVKYVYSFNVFFILNFSFLQGILFSPIVNILISNKDFKFMSFSIFVILFLNILSNYFIVKNYGALGVAIVTFFTHFILNFSFFLRIKIRLFVGFINNN